MEEQIIFEKEKVTMVQKISEELLNGLKLETYKDIDAYFRKTMTLRLSGFIYSNLADERNLDYYFDRPTFFEWLFRKRRKATFNLKVKDLLLNAPKTDNSIRIYVVSASEKLQR